MFQILLEYLKRKTIHEKPLRLLVKFIDRFYDRFTSVPLFLTFTTKTISRSVKYRYLKFDTVLNILQFYSLQLTDSHIISELLFLIKQILFSFPSSFYKNAHILKHIWSSNLYHCRHLGILYSLDIYQNSNIDMFFKLTDHIASHRDFSKHSWIFLYEYFIFLHQSKNKERFEHGLYSLLKAVNKNMIVRIKTFLNDEQKDIFEQAYQEYIKYYKFHGP
ncbi:hypothetical protein HZS_1003 [Henneguya salminicola]|nr:hypothetical protein HZS_1003 [Henneguya salminicola]